MRKAYFINDEKDIVTKTKINKKGKNCIIYEKLPLRILYPEEVLAIIKVLEDMGKSAKDDLTNFKMLLLLGCRYVEAQWIQLHPECFDKEGRNIRISTLKVKVKNKTRNIKLSNMAMNEIRHFFDSDKYLSEAHTFDKKLKRLAKVAGLDKPEVGISQKMLRKTWESWLMDYYTGSDMKILKSQGHTAAVSLEHYQGIPFTPKDREQMREFCDGWI